MQVKPPQEVLNAMGVLLNHMLLSGYDVDGGCFIQADLSVGIIPNDTDIGEWRFDVKRIRKPGAPK
jgi:hypothetical protein